MNTRFRMRHVVVVAPLLASGCGWNSGTDPVPNVAGRWAGRADTTSILLDIRQSGRSLTGSGSLSSGSSSAIVQVSGTVTGGGQDTRVSMTLTSEDFSPITFAAHTVIPDLMIGDWRGAGGDPRTASLSRLE